MAAGFSIFFSFCVSSVRRGGEVSREKTENECRKRNAPENYVKSGRTFGWGKSADCGDGKLCGKLGKHLVESKKHRVQNSVENVNNCL